MRTHRLLAAGWVAAGLAVGAGAPGSAGAAATPSAPVIHESFKPLPCPSKPSSTVQIEGCAEHRVLTADRTIDRLDAKVFAKLGRSGRTTFATAAADWLRYRDAACTSEASIYSGGSIRPVAYANCLVAIDHTHVRELRTMLVALSPAG